MSYRLEINAYRKKRSVPFSNGIDRLLYDIELLTNGWLWLLSWLLS